MKPEEKCVDWLCRQGAIEEEDRELYQYAIYRIGITLAPLALSVLVGVIMGMAVESLLFMLPFMCLRKYSGGYHAGKAWICVILSTVAMASGTWLSGKMQNSFVIILLLVISAISLWIKSPVAHENRRLTPDEAVEYRKKAHMILGIFIVVYAGVSLFRLQTYAVAVALGVALAAVMQWICTGEGAGSCEER